MRVFETKITEKSLLKVNKILRSGELGFGNNVLKFESQFKRFSNKKYNIATNSGSGAAFMIFAFLKDKYGCCNVYTPSLAFTSPAWAAKHFGHNLIWVDVDNDLLFDCKDYLRRRVDNENKTVIMPILYGGVSTIDNWELLGDEIVVVDSAHCATPSLVSDFTFFSFHPYKPICSSDGGMISTNHHEAYDYFNLYRNFGRYNTETSYDITHNGFKFYMNNLNATIGLTSLKEYDTKLRKRKNNFNKLRCKCADFNTVLFNQKLLPHDDRSSYYYATIICSDDRVGIVKKHYPIPVHYPMLHHTKYYCMDQETSLPNTEKLHQSIINIPLYKTT